jgi:hypothetical protein
VRGFRVGEIRQELVGFVRRASGASQTREQEDEIRSWRRRGSI